jgi:endonuclease YncB( thermonuclease family)
MKKLIFFYSIALTLIFATAVFAQSRVNGKVVGVVNGKTVIIETPNRSRLVAELQYIEVPEDGQPLSEIAAQHLRDLVLDQIVEFRAKGLTQVKTVGQLFLNGVDISQQMIRDGAAWYAVLEKGSQDAAESSVYQSNEAQAKNEKRGVWSIENLKPSWQIRAEAIESRKRLNELSVEKVAEQVLTAQKLQPKTQVQREARIPPTTSYANNFILPSNTKIIGGLLVGYEPSTELSVTATPLMNINVIGKNDKQEVSIQVAHFYSDGSGIKAKKNVYLVGIGSESRDFKFLEYNELIVTADNQKIIIGEARRVAGKNANGVRETLLYKIQKNVLTKIANAKNVEIKVGTYSRRLNSEIQVLLSNLMQTSP